MMLWTAPVEDQRAEIRTVVIRQGQDDGFVVHIVSQSYLCAAFVSKRQIERQARLEVLRESHVAQ